METFFLILLTLEIAACITGFVFWGKLKKSYWRLFPIYLALIVVIEGRGAYFRYILDEVASNSLHNYFGIPVGFLFFFFIFYRSFKGEKYRWLPVLCSALYLFTWLVDIVYFSKFQLWFYSFSYTVGNVLLLILILVFLIRLITTDAILDFKHNMLFWVSIGLLVFYLGTLPYFGLRNTMINGYHGLYISYSYLMFVLNWCMYLMFIIGFIWSKPNTKYS